MMTTNLMKTDYKKFKIDNYMIELKFCHNLLTCMLFILLLN